MLDIGSGLIYLAEEFKRDSRGDVCRDSEANDKQGARPRVLIVDDERLIADTCAEILKDAGFDTRTAYDGWEALETVGEFQPDYLLTDVLMPRMNGVELAIYVSKKLPDAKILLFSGQAGISDILIHSREQGYKFELVAKPIHPTKLIERLQRDQR